jgi:hypothetical protein
MIQPTSPPPSLWSPAPEDRGSATILPSPRNQEQDQRPGQAPERQDLVIGHLPERQPGAERAMLERHQPGAYAEEGEEGHSRSVTWPRLTTEAEEHQSASTTRAPPMISPRSILLRLGPG